MARIAEFGGCCQFDQVLVYVLERSSGMDATWAEYAVSVMCIGGDVGLEDVGGSVERYSTSDGCTSGKFPSAGVDELRKLSGSVTGLDTVEPELFEADDAIVCLFFLLADKRRVTNMRV